MTTMSPTFNSEIRRGLRARQPEVERRAVYRERETGVGYGNSSGYATARRYARGWVGQPRFRCG